MKVSPALRRAAHQAVDLILDALAEDERALPKKRARAATPPPAVKPARELTREEHAQLERQLRRAGYRA